MASNYSDNDMKSYPNMLKQNLTTFSMQMLRNNSLVVPSKNNTKMSNDFHNINASDFVLQNAPQYHNAIDYRD